MARPKYPRVVELVRDFSWTERANCKSTDTANFYPEKADPLLMKKLSAAREACAECPVRQECLDYAIEYEPLGFWGGMTEKDRKLLRRKNGRPVRARVFN